MLKSLGVGLAASVVVGAGAFGPATTSARADIAGVPGSLSSIAETTSTLDVPVPDGVVPRRIGGRLAVARPTGGEVTISVGGRRVLSVPATRSGRISFPVRTADVSRAGTIPVALTYRGTDDPCADPGDAATLTDLRLAYTGRESAPATVGTFFSPAVSRVDVVVAPDAGDGVLQAGLAAVAAIANRYPTDTAVTLTTSDGSLPRRTAGQRVVRIDTADTSSVGVSDLDGVPTMDIAGDDDDLLAASRSLAEPALALALANAASTQGLGSRARALDDDTTRTLADLGVERVRLAGYGRSSSYVGIKQDAFGGPISQLDLRLVGTHTAVPYGTQAQLDVRLNDVLLASTIIEGADPIDLEVTAPGSVLKSDNGLELVFSAVTEGRCTSDTDRLPLEVDIDGSRTTLEATRGEGAVSGFESYPQVLGGELPVAIRATGPDRAGAAADAATLVAALQRASSRPLAITLVDADDFIDSDRSGLLVGADRADSDALGAPLRLDGMRLLDYAEATFEVGTDQPYAALEAISSGGRRVLMLGGWSPDETLAAGLTQTAVDRVARLGWGSLTDDLLIADGQGPAFTLSSNAVVPQSVRTEERSSFGWWFVLGIAVLLLLLGAQTWVSRRRERRVQAVVDAQERADRQADASSPQD